MSTESDPERDARFSALSAEAHRIGEQPDIGRPEVERLVEIVDEMRRILDSLPEERLRKYRSRLHEPRGRAVDFWPKPPGWRLTDWAERRSDGHIHWAWDPPQEDG